MLAGSWVWAGILIGVGSEALAGMLIGVVVVVGSGIWAGMLVGVGVGSEKSLVVEAVVEAQPSPQAFFEVFGSGALVLVVVGSGVLA